MKKLAVIGYPIKHSYSPLIHNFISKKLNAPYVYEQVETPPDELGDVVKKLKDEGYLGFNVTAPYKEKVIEYLDEVSQDARLFGAVNTVVNKSGKLIGYNTDALGFYEALCYRNINPEGKHILMLGAGGAARSVAIKLAAKCDTLTVINRTKERLSELKRCVFDCTGHSIETELSRKTYDIIINCTSLGMIEEKSPLDDLSVIGENTFCVDLIYSPWRTKFLKESQNAGAKCQNGIYMLVFQAILAYRLFTGIDVPLSMADDIIKEVLSGRNIVLTGFMASGKTYIGKALAEKLERPFFDTDFEVEKECKMSITEIFEKKGEEYFRGKEVQVTEKISQEKGAVIATGGGAVLNADNVQNLRKNGTIVNLEPEYDVIAKRLSRNNEKRPLTKGQNIDDILERFEKRKPYYESCDLKIKITKNSDKEEVVNAILKGLEEMI